MYFDSQSTVVCGARHCTKMAQNTCFGNHFCDRHKAHLRLIRKELHKAKKSGDIASELAWRIEEQHFRKFTDACHQKQINILYKTCIQSKLHSRALTIY